MNDFVSELLDGLKTGDRVRVRVGTGSNQEVIEGTIERWSDFLLFLRKADDGVAKIVLDDLRMIDPVSAIHSSDSKESPASITNVFIPGIVPPPTYGNAISRSFQQLSLAQSISYGTDSILAEVKAKSKTVSCPALKQSMGGVFDSLTNAIKCNQIKDKYHDMRAKLLSESWTQCKTDTDFQAVYYFLGALAVISADFNYALEPLVRAKQFKLAAFAAASAGDAESTQVFTICALLNGERVDIDQYVSSILAQKIDVHTLKHLVEKFKDSPIHSEKLATCAYTMFISANAILKSPVTPYSSAYSAANDMLNSIPANIISTKPIIDYWKLFSGHKYPTCTETTDGDDLITGTILYFNEDRRIGFIKNNPNSNVNCSPSRGTMK